ncbi:type VI secretion system Vgr family protein [Viridibacterium curvum]|uniref:Type VI secretion system tip protein VgrG n=1 Tax=Viridibacterium curvum TaxID=1101404 RepID=A0ABP9QP68_9RHOO
MASESMQSWASKGAGISLPSRESFLKALTQNARLLSLTTCLPDAALVPERFIGSEGVSQVSCFDIDCLSTNAHFSLASLIGQPVTLRLLLADGRSHRQWHGYVTLAGQLGSDGGLARYRLRMQPWLAVLAERRNARIFQDQSAEDILHQLFDECGIASYEFRLTQPLKPRSLTIQYRESDLAFASRLLASEGLSYRFEHDQTAASGQSGDTPPHSLHKLVIFDSAQDLAACPQALIRFHRAGATEGSDSFQQWHTRQEVLTNDVTLASWDYKQLVALNGQSDVDGAPFGGLGNVPTLESFDGSGAYRYDSAEEASRQATLRTQAIALCMEAHTAQGTVRQLAPSQQFTVLQHPHYHGDAARFTVLRVQHEAANNLDSNAKRIEGLAVDSDVEPGTYRNRIVCTRAQLPLVPQPLPKPHMPGLQSAIVVGTAKAKAGTSTHAERDHRIKIQFPWQRGAAPLVGGLTSDTERATGDDSNGTWVRVAESLAGPNWGSSFTPRVGTEVLVDFLNGDPDRPIIVAQLYNGQDAPPWPAGEGSSANHPGILAGFHAPTLDGQGWSQWQLDDATGQLRTRLATSFARSELNLGYLIHQTPTNSQRGAYRGQGFELRTDGWSITRAAQGMLLSTTARQNATSTQLDTSEAAGQLKAAHDTANRLSDAASQSEADPLAQTKQIDAFQQKIHPEEAKKDGNDQPDRDIKSFSSPAILIEAPASIALTTPQSSSLFAGEQLSTTVQADTQITAQHTASLVSGDATSLYTHAGGIKAIAANSPLSIQSHDGPLEVLADQNVTVTSSNDEIHILASSKIVLQAGQSSITLEGANITFACPGNFTAKGASHVMAGGGSAAASLGALPTGQAVFAVSSAVEAGDEKSLRDNESLPILRVTPSTLSFTQNVMVKAERVDGQPISPNSYFQLGDVTIRDYWISSSGKAYFITPEKQFSGAFAAASIGSEQFKLESRVQYAKSYGNATSSLDKQIEILREVSKDKGIAQGRSQAYWRDQVLTVGYYRLQLAIDDLTKSASAQADKELVAEWRSKLADN